VNEGLGKAGDLIFNCQMGRGRTTTGMVCASLIAHVLYGDYRMEENHVQGNAPAPSAAAVSVGMAVVNSNREEEVSEEETYLNGACLFVALQSHWRFPSHYRPKSGRGSLHYSSS